MTARRTSTVTSLRCQKVNNVAVVLTLRQRTSNSFTVSSSYPCMPAFTSIIFCLQKIHFGLASSHVLFPLPLMPSHSDSRTIWKPLRGFDSEGEREREIHNNKRETEQSQTIMADEATAKGNAAFSAGNYADAIRHFTVAINLAPASSPTSTPAPPATTPPATLFLHLHRLLLYLSTKLICKPNEEHIF